MNNRNEKLYRMVVAALLCAIAILIPMFSPVKFVLEPMSFTLASHVAVFIAMFISPFVAIAVNLGATLGFFLTGLPFVIALRALSQVIFVAVGALWLKKYPDIMRSLPKMSLFAIVISVIHALGEIAVVMPFYFSNGLAASAYSKGFFTTVLGLVGVGTFVHSLVDFAIAVVLWKAIGRVRAISKLSVVGQI